MLKTANQNFNTIFIIGIILLSISLFSCVPSPDRLKSKATNSIEVPPKGYSLLFYEIDNYAVIYIDGKEIANTNNLRSEKQKEIVVDLSKSITPRSKEMIIKIFNTECTSCRSNTWTATYGIYIDGKEVEYVNESSEGKQAEIGHMYTKNHSLD